MSLLRSLLLLLGLTLGIATQATAQPRYFTMAGFNLFNGVRDTSHVVQFWIKSDGIPDSIVVNGIHEYFHWVYSDWHKVSYHIPEGHFYLSFFPFAACSTRNNFPGELRYYRKTSAGQTYLVWHMTSVFQDTLLRQTTRHMFDSNGIEQIIEFNYFDYDSNGLASDYRHVMLTPSDTDSHEGFHVDRLYDSVGHVISCLKTSFQRNRSTIVDSQYFEYGNNDTIIYSEYWEEHLPGTKPKVGLKSFYHNWFRVTRPLLYFTQGDGLQDLLYYSSATFVSNRTVRDDFTDTSRTTREYDTACRLTKEWWQYNADAYASTESSYYPDGDLYEQYYESSAEPRTLTRHIEHTYGASGLLMSALDSSYTFDYPFLSVRSASEERAISSIGDKLSLESSRAHVMIYNVAGLLMLDAVATERTVDLSHFPAGVYMVSINSGKPRKHLIP